MKDIPCGWIHIKPRVYHCMLLLRLITRRWHISGSYLLTWSGHSRPSTPRWTRQKVLCISYFIHIITSVHSNAICAEWLAFHTIHDIDSRFLWMNCLGSVAVQNDITSDFSSFDNLPSVQYIYNKWMPMDVQLLKYWLKTQEARISPKTMTTQSAIMLLTKIK